MPVGSLPDSVTQCGVWGYSSEILLPMVVFASRKLEKQALPSSEVGRKDSSKGRSVTEYIR